MAEEINLYEAMGGRATFEQLVSHFYALVAVDPVLRPMYPDEDFKGAANRLLMFLEQYWAVLKLIVKNGAIHGYGCAIQHFTLVKLREISGCNT